MPGDVEHDTDRRQKKTITNQSGEPPATHSFLVALHDRTSSSAPAFSAYNLSTLRPRHGSKSGIVQADGSFGHLWWQFLQTHIGGSSFVIFCAVPPGAAILFEDVVRRLTLEL
jgi:hypothetical protein